MVPWKLIIMNIIEMIINQTEGPNLVKRIIEDDWQQKTFLIQLNVDVPEIEDRTTSIEYLGL